MTEYEILGVAPRATIEAIRERYLVLMRTEHPDKGGTTERCAELTLAYNRLRDPKNRAKIDKTIELTGRKFCSRCSGRGTNLSRGKLVVCKSCGGTGW